MGGAFASPFLWRFVADSHEAIYEICTTLAIFNPSILCKLPSLQIPQSMIIYLCNQEQHRTASQEKKFEKLEKTS
jgi:hypothetical protein